MPKRITTRDLEVCARAHGLSAIDCRNSAHCEVFAPDGFTFGGAGSIVYVYGGMSGGYSPLWRQEELTRAIQEIPELAQSLDVDGAMARATDRRRHRWQANK